VREHIWGPESRSEIISRSSGSQDRRICSVQRLPQEFWMVDSVMAHVNQGEGGKIAVLLAIADAIVKLTW
jgi:hypothetical protein